MSNLIYNGQVISLDRKGRVNVAQLYNAAGKPPNRKPNNFSRSKDGDEAIKRYEYQGRYVWESRRGSHTLAVVALACIYLKYLDDPGAANALRKIPSSSEDIIYNSPEYISLQSQKIATTIHSSKNESPNWLLIIFLFCVVAGIFQRCQPQQTPQYQPYSPPTQYRPLSFK
ncbi:MAG: hypothetical protein ACM37W_00900 [Actinomycetota bacterium]